MASLAQDLIAAAGAVAEFGADARGFEQLTDDALLDAQVTISKLTKLSQTFAAWAAGEVSRRSSREAGYNGLARRKGFGNAESLIQSLTKVPRAEATKYVHVGVMMAHERDVDVPQEWHAAIGRSVGAGALSLDGAEAIRRGLGEPDASVTIHDLTTAAEALLVEARALTVEELFRRARQLRDLLDADGIARREKQRVDQRFVKRWIRPDGMYQASILLDPENGLTLFSALDQIIAPRRGGPRFVDSSQLAWAAGIVADPRTDEQLLADALVEMVRIAGEADPGTLFGGRRPAVRVIVTEKVIRDRAGHGFLEGDPQPISFETIERHLCDTGVIAIKFDDDGQCINLGRTQRLFTARQRVGLAVRDGGCRWPGCEKPASFAEAHHIDTWTVDDGETNLEDGVLLCRNHHMLLHNNHWHVVRVGASYWLRPPKTEDPVQELRSMPTKSAQMRELFG